MYFCISMFSSILGFYLLGRCVVCSLFLLLGQVGDGFPLNLWRSLSPLNFLSLFKILTVLDISILLLVLPGCEMGGIAAFWILAIKYTNICRYASQRWMDLLDLFIQYFFFYCIIKIITQKNYWIYQIIITFWKPSLRREFHLLGKNKQKNWAYFSLSAKRIYENVLVE